MKNSKLLSKSKKPSKAVIPKFRYVIRKYVIAKTLEAALKAEHKAPVHEVFVAEQVRDDRGLSDAIGFEHIVIDSEE